MLVLDSGGLSRIAPSTRALAHVRTSPSVVTPRRAGPVDTADLAGRAANADDVRIVFVGDRQLSLTDYDVVMTHPLSVRFRRDDVVRGVKREAEVQRRSISALIEELVDEGLRSRRHPLIAFRSGAAGRRAAIVGGPDVWEVIAGIVGGDVPAERRIERAVEVFDWPRPHIEAALAYYTEFTEEIDTEIESNGSAAADAEKAWHRGRGLLAK